MRSSVGILLRRAAATLKRGAGSLEALAARFELPVVQRDLVLDVDGQARLAATLSMPDGAGPVDAVLLLAGSGPVDRDGNTPGMRCDTLKYLAAALGSDGFAVLRADKRGIGASASPTLREEDVSIETFVSDAVRWLATLRSQPRVRRLIVLGHSEGALVATLAAARVPLDGIVLVAAPGQPLGDVLRRQLRGASLPEQLAVAADAIIARLERGETVADPPGELLSLFRPSAQPYLVSLLAVDPVAALAACGAPALVVQGTTDLQVTLDDARRLVAARPGIRLVIIEGMNHVLKTAPADRAGQQAAYADPRLPLADGLVAPIVGFLRTVAERR